LENSNEKTIPKFSVSKGHLNKTRIDSLFSF